MRDAMAHFHPYYSKENKGHKKFLNLIKRYENWEGALNCHDFQV